CKSDKKMLKKRSTYTRSFKVKGHIREENGRGKDGIELRSDPQPQPQQEEEEKLRLVQPFSNLSSLFSFQFIIHLTSA
ncbi:MAG: hypothetical protein Q8754_02550, partial [Sweet potato little leaf phytoplasma]|nr:hypothetical protein [Sweet potato little leaf phytoplasma]